MVIPLVFVWYFYQKWAHNGKDIIYATTRMVIQLLAIGYVLIYIFENKSYFIGIGILSVMIVMSSVITLRNIDDKSLNSFLRILFSLSVGGTLTLILVIVFVLEINHFYEPRYVIPIAGMIYANAMNSVSIAAERFEKEIGILSFYEARKAAFKASMISKVNAMLAVGLVSLPGMMTGQILSGIDPLIAVRYQIVVMAMILSGGGISVILYLKLIEKNYLVIK